MTLITEIPSYNSDANPVADYKTFCKRMLKTQLFIGSFQEKRYVEHLASYRDVVKVDSDEKLFIENLLVVKKKLRGELIKNSSWIGITEPDIIGAPVGYNIWVILPEGMVFGTYWFKVKTVEFLNNEVRLKVDVVRNVGDKKSTSFKSDSEESQSFSFASAAHDLSDSFKSNVNIVFKEYVTFTNIKSTVVFFIVFTTTLLVGAINMIKYLMEYFLKFMKEFSGFIKVCTPIIVSCLDLVRKVIFGLFALIVTLLRGNRPIYQQPIYMEPNPMLQYDNSYYNYNSNYPRRRALPYKSSVSITPLD